MRIVYCSDSAIPSTSPNSVHVMKMCQAFAALGHDVTLIGKNTTACLEDIHDVHEFYAVQRSFKVKVFPSVAFKGSGLYYNLSFLWRAISLKADLLYTRSISAAFFLLLFNKRVIFEVHEPFEGKGWRLRSMFRFVVGRKGLEGFVVISRALKQYYSENLGIENERILVAHDGADPLPVAKPLIIDSRFKVGYVGSLYPGKGIEIILQLARLCKGIAFHVVGGTKGQLEEFANEVYAVPNLTFHGFKTQKEIPAYISSFDALVAPYLNKVVVSKKSGANNLALWMSPLKIFEYMSSGKPIIASNLPVIREILRDKQNALLCNPDDLAEWKTAIETLMQSHELSVSISSQALSEFNLFYTWTKRAEIILNYSSSLINNRM